MSRAQGPLPVTVIGGYLGAGKTTMVNHMLRHAGGRRLMVLVNDFGELPIDADLIASADGDTLNLANGCVCCTMGGDLFNALVDVLERSPHPDHLVIEASGVADPARIANIARAEPDLALDAIVVLADGLNFCGHASDPMIGETVRGQLAGAHIIVLNKSDQISPGQIAAVTGRLEKLGPAAQIIVSEHCRVPTDILTGVHLTPGAEQAPAGGGGHHHHLYAKWARDWRCPMPRKAFEAALNQAAASALRIKGIVYFKDSPQPVCVQCVAGRCTLDPAPAETGRSSRMVAIGLKERLDCRALDDLLPVVGS